MWRETDSHANAITYEEAEAGIVSGPVPLWRRVTRIADRNLPFGGTWMVEIVPADGGSKVTITENGEVYNPFFRFASHSSSGTRQLSTRT